MRSSYLEYAMSVIVARALPDIRDGLKPVQRRILYAMQELGMRPNTAYKKSARLVGEVLGKYHPHGDVAVYDAMVRLAQPFSLRLPLVDGQGNFGSVDGDPAAAMRYTEASSAASPRRCWPTWTRRPSTLSTTSTAPCASPWYCPPGCPTFWSTAPQVSPSAWRPIYHPTTPSELCNAIVRLIDNPDITVEELMRSVRGPDFPTGGTIMGREGIKSAYFTGRGQIIVRAKAEIEPMARSNRMHIVVSELPYQVNKASLVEKIASLVKERRIDGITEIRDESDREGMRIVMELRGATQPLVILNNLYKLTPMQSSFSANMLALVGGTPRVITLKQALVHFVEFRRSVITRRSEYELKRARERAHILAGLRIALSNLDDVIALIRSSEDSDAAKKGLITRFGLDEPQAQAILEMQLRRIAALERERLEQEYQELQKTIAGLVELLADPAKVLAEVRGETQELKKRVGQPRRTDISDAAYDFSREELEAHEQVVVTLSQGGYIKRIPAGTYRSQHRGGKGVTGMNIREDDPVRHVLVVDTHDALLFFTDRGRVLKITAYELRPDTSRNTRGVPVVNVMPLTETERVNAVIGVRSLQEEDTYLVMVTRRGIIKRVALSAVSSIRPSGLIIMNLKPDDELVEARLATEEEGRHPGVGEGHVDKVPRDRDTRPAQSCRWRKGYPIPHGRPHSINGYSRPR